MQKKEAEVFFPMEKKVRLYHVQVFRYRHFNRASFNSFSHFLSPFWANRISLLSRTLKQKSLLSVLFLASLMHKLCTFKCGLFAVHFVFFEWRKYCGVLHGFWTCSSTFPGSSEGSKQRECVCVIIQSMVCVDGTRTDTVRPGSTCPAACDLRWSYIWTGFCKVCFYSVCLLGAPCYHQIGYFLSVMVRLYQQASPVMTR